MPHPALSTARLLLTPLSVDDAPAIQATFPRWEIVRYLVDSVPWPYPAGAAREYVERVALPAMAAGHGWFWTLQLRSQPGQLIGMITLSDNPDNNRGFWLAPEWQRQGLMSEACAAVTEFWFNILQRSRLTVAKARENTGSVKLTQRSGMRLIRRTRQQYVSGELDTEIWQTDRATWRRLYGARAGNGGVK